MGEIEIPEGPLLFGAKRIGAFVGATDQQVYKLMSGGHLPFVKIGRLVVCKRQTLIDFINQREFTPRQVPRKISSAAL